MFIKDQKVMYLTHDVEATVVDPGSTLTMIMIFNLSYDGGRPNFLTVDTTDLIDMDTYLSNKRNEKINDILE